MLRALLCPDSELHIAQTGLTSAGQRTRVLNYSTSSTIRYAILAEVLPVHIRVVLGGWVERAGVEARLRRVGCGRGRQVT